MKSPDLLPPPKKKKFVNVYKIRINAAEAAEYLFTRVIIFMQTYFLRTAEKTVKNIVVLFENEYKI